MAYKKAVPENMQEIAVSDVFINNYMPDANGNFVKVYLLGLSQCIKDNPMTTAQMADKLSMLESDIVRAWSYWADRNVVKFDGENVEFLELNTVKKIPPTETKPSYYAEEITACASANRQLSEMFRIVEKILDKPLSSADLMVIYSFYDFYRIPLDVIPMLVAYCVGTGKKSMRQIEKTAGVWVDKGIDSVESAEVYIRKVEEHTRLINRIKESVGVSDRSLSPTETKYINNWLYDMKMPFEMIICAYELCCGNSGRFSVKDMDKIISGWHKDGVKTVNKLKEITAKQKLLKLRFKFMCKGIELLSAG